MNSELQAHPKLRTIFNILYVIAASTEDQYMRIISAIAFLMMTGCYGPFNPVNKASNDKSSDNAKACTLIASMTLIQVHIESAQPLPANLTLALNGGAVTADECLPIAAFETAVRVSADRLTANAYFYLDGTSEHANYFGQVGGSPTSNNMNLTLNGRTSCADTITQVNTFANVAIQWTSQFANGTNCDSSGYKGNADLAIP